MSRIPAGVGVDVRLDLVRHSRDIVLNVVASSCHLLGVLTLLEEQTVARMVARGELPERIVEMLDLIRNELFDVGADLSTPKHPSPQWPPLRIEQPSIDRLEAW